MPGCMDSCEQGRNRTLEGVCGIPLLSGAKEDGVDRVGSRRVKLRLHSCRSKKAGRYPCPSDPAEAPSSAGVGMDVLYGRGSRKRRSSSMLNWEVSPGCLTAHGWEATQ